MCSGEFEDVSAAREIGVYGRVWRGVHGGYFSDPAVARSLLDVVAPVLRATQPAAVVDWGGGTGFLLAQLRRRSVARGLRLLNVDLSPEQQSAAPPSGIQLLTAPLEKVTRRRLAAPGERLLFLMRSVLHYFGRRGLDGVLRHLRAQARLGEFLVHQTASFDRPADAACLSELYRRMGLSKWYPSTADLAGRLRAARWEVVGCRLAPALRLRQTELAARYGVTRARMERVRAQICARHGALQSVFAPGRTRFVARLHYRIWVCRAS